MCDWASQVALVVKNPPANAGDVRMMGSIPGWGRCPGGGHSNPLQCSCLENPTDRVASWALVRRSAKSWTWWSDWAQAGNVWPLFPETLPLSSNSWLLFAPLLRVRERRPGTGDAERHALAELTETEQTGHEEWGSEEKPQGGESLPRRNCFLFPHPLLPAAVGSSLLTFLKQTRSQSQISPTMLPHSLLPRSPVQGSATGVSEKAWKCLVRLSTWWRQMWHGSLKNETLASSCIAIILCQCWCSGPSVPKVRMFPGEAQSYCFFFPPEGSASIKAYQFCDPFILLIS